MATFRLHTAVAGRNAGVFDPQYVWLSRLEDSANGLVWTNAETDPVFDGGTPDKGHFAAVIAAMPHVPEDSTLEIIAKEKSTLWWPFKEGPEGPKEQHHRKDSGSLFIDHIPIRMIDELAKVCRIGIVARPPASAHEKETLAQAGDDVRVRRDNAEEAFNLPDTKFG